MPELPEVQTIISDLNRKIRGDMIVDFWSDWGKAIKGENIEQFRKEIKGKKILGARRIGKNIFLDLFGGKTLYIHLKMTGHLLVKPHPNPLPALPAGRLVREGEQKQNLLLNKEKVRRHKVGADEVRDYFSDKINQYIHHIWKLKAKNEKLKTLEFSDLRKFGKIVLDNTDKINNLKEIKFLGVDAINGKFTLKKFEEILNKKNKTLIGILLMEQNLVSGIGNIYRSEILFEAGVLPTRKISDINPKERKKIYGEIKKVLKKAIKYRGTSDSDYRDTSGAPGNFQKVLSVYQKAGQKCRRCGTIIKRIKLGQRSAFYCIKCQK